MEKYAFEKIEDNFGTFFAFSASKKK